MIMILGRNEAQCLVVRYSTHPFCNCSVRLATSRRHTSAPQIILIRDTVWMVIEVMKRRVVAFLSLMACIPAAVIRAAEPGTIGVQVSQLYSDQQETHRGGLVIRRVVPASGAAEAGLRPGDLILGVDGQSVEGHERKESLGWLNGTAGTLVQLTVISQDGRRDVRVRRKPYPPHLNSASDPFSYQIPGNWLVDPRYTFPLPWAIDLRYEGFEDVGF